jgi:hypothetical protein
VATPAAIVWSDKDTTRRPVGVAIIKVVIVAPVARGDGDRTPPPPKASRLRRDVAGAGVGVDLTPSAGVAVQDCRGADGVDGWLLLSDRTPVYGALGTIAAGGAVRLEDRILDTFEKLETACAEMVAAEREMALLVASEPEGRQTWQQFTTAGSGVAVRD